MNPKGDHIANINAGKIQDLYLGGKKEEAAAAVPDELIDEVSLVGSAQQIADEMGLSLSLSDRTYLAPLPFHPALIETVRRYAIEEGQPWQDIVTGAGHDACQMGQILPTTMIFVPCEDGISHNEAEDMTKEWAEAGGSVLLHAALELAEVQS